MTIIPKTVQEIGYGTWTVRFSPPEPGAWQYRIEVREARGMAQSDVR